MEKIGWFIAQCVMLALLLVTMGAIARAVCGLVLVGWRLAGAAF